MIETDNIFKILSEIELNEFFDEEIYQNTIKGLKFLIYYFYY